MIYKTDKINNEITINNRIISREYLTKISKYSGQITKLELNKEEVSKNLEKKLTKK